MVTTTNSAGQYHPPHHPPHHRPPRRPHAPRRAVTWAWEVIAEHGTQLDDGTVNIGRSQAELSRLGGHRRNDGRIYAYVRDLGDVVVQRRGELILDQRRLAELERTMVVRPLTQRTIDVGARLTEAFGRPAADGTIVLSVDTPEGERPARLGDMASELGMNRSSTHRHLRALQNHSDRPVDAHTLSPAAELAERVALLEELVDLDHQIIAGLSRRAELCAALHLDGGPADSIAPPSRPEGAMRAENPADRAPEGAMRAGFPADHGSQDEIRSDENASSSLISSPEAAPCAPENPRPCAPENPRTGEEPAAGRTDGFRDDVLALCPDLIAGCERHNLPGPTNLDGLTRALAGRTADEIRHAQKRIARDLTGGRIRNPFGLLASVADAAHESHRVYFRPRPDRTASPVVLLDEEPPVDTEAVAAVTALAAAGDTTALDGLDRSIADTYRSPRAVDAIRNDPAALLASRARAWRCLHPGGTP